MPTALSVRGCTAGILAAATAATLALAGPADAHGEHGHDGQPGPALAPRTHFTMAPDGSSGLTCSMPIADLAVHWDRERALALLKLVKEDRTDDIGKDLCTPTGLPQQ